jgi:hypothetical protein
MDYEAEVFFIDDPDFWTPTPEHCEELIANAVMAFFFKHGGGLLVTPEVANEIALRIATSVVEYNA